MPFLATLLAQTADRAHRATTAIAHRYRDASRTRREHDLLRNFEAMNDDRLYDLGLSREAIRCGLNATHHPLSAARACRERPVGGLNSRRWGEASDAQSFRRERYLGW